jgi:hypothetical protein
MVHPTSLKKEIVSEKQSGKSLLQISNERSISYSTVKRIWSKYQKEGEQGLVSKYDNCGAKKPLFYKISRMSVWLKRKHRSWGAPFILTILGERYPNENCLMYERCNNGILSRD